MGDLKDRFSVQAQSMIRALEDFRAELVGEQERLKDKPKKEAIISNKIREVEDTIQLLTERHLDSIEDDYPDFETAKSDLLVDLDLIRQGVGVMQFSQEEQGILHEHSNLLKRTGLLGGITDTESNLQRITEEASERFKANPLA
ncbi:TPA: hypothetical protein ACU9KK_003793 [Legionella anisa]|uniref:hypothetical protein n=1 Tax=Legionella anisa TaxID=28082 RepID=UPI000FD85A1C|nr:hypothetical protein [Legionella anisa]MCW8448412.1 hypothetical protein [Legionella anisa]